ncbi:MAG: mannonate dehydratase [Anaerolineae bacterium]|nr:mannonate dehydratase [Anaerolineae bacterium]
MGSGARVRLIMEDIDPVPCKPAHIVRWNTPDADLLFCRQIGLRWVRVLCGDLDPSVGTLRRVQQRLADHGLQVWSAVHDTSRSLRIQLGQPGRDEDIETYRTFIRSLGVLGIPVAAYDFHPGNVYTTAHVAYHGYQVREFDLDVFLEEVQALRFGRQIPEEEMWANYAHFLRAILPAAEEAGVLLALHPDDPPIAHMNGVARLFCRVDGYRRALEIAGESPAWGINLCVGTWAEGGSRMGQSVLGMIEEFGRAGRIGDVHYRNVSAPLPHFVETLPDDGYVDMWGVMRALCRVGYRGAVYPDHIPQLSGDDAFRRGGLAYSVAHMRAALRQANEDVG